MYKRQAKGRRQRLGEKDAADAARQQHDQHLIYLLPGFVTQDARAFVLGAVCSFAGVAVFYWRRASKGQTKEAPVRGLRTR